jgi:hypothetical protein
MSDIDVVLGDLEWRRIRRRLTMRPAVALPCNIGATALIFVLRSKRPHIPPPAPSTVPSRSGRHVALDPAGGAVVS